MKRYYSIGISKKFDTNKIDFSQFVRGKERL